MSERMPSIKTMLGDSVNARDLLYTAVRMCTSALWRTTQEFQQNHMVGTVGQGAKLGTSKAGRQQWSVRQSPDARVSEPKLYESSRKAGSDYTSGRARATHTEG